MMIYKILSRTEWREAMASGVFEGSQVDLRDRFIHFSTASQLAETARLHFGGQADLVLLAVPTEALGATLKWEPSRGGALFPHLYGSLACSAVVEARAYEPGDLPP